MGRGSFDGYEDAIRRLPGGELCEADLLTPEFLLYEEGSLAVYYVPFEGVNEDARVVMVGITPGFTQMRIAFEAVRDALRAGESREVALRAAQEEASFAGSMRVNLDRMLDEVGLPGMLGIGTTDELFSDRIDLLHSTSALRDPVFVAGRNYTGSAPRIERSPVLRRTVIEGLGPELEAIPDAVVIPLGMAVEGALRILIDAGRLDPDRCCFGFPHPSGANGHRKRLFEENRLRIASTLGAWQLRDALALSRLIRDHGFSRRFCARIVDRKKNGRQILYVADPLGKSAYRVRDDREWLDGAEAEELRDLLSAMWTRQFPGRVERAMFRAEWASWSPWAETMLPTLVGGLEALLKTRRNGGLTKHFKVCASALAAELGVEGIDPDFCARVYDSRSDWVHGSPVRLFGGDDPDPTEEQRVGVLAEIALVQDLLRAACRRAIEDPEFCSVFESSAAINARWPG